MTSGRSEPPSAIRSNNPDRRRPRTPPPAAQHLMRLRTSSQTPAPGTRRTSTDDTAGTHSRFRVVGRFRLQVGQVLGRVLAISQAAPGQRGTPRNARHPNARAPNAVSTLVRPSVTQHTSCKRPALLHRHRVDGASTYRCMASAVTKRFDQCSAKAAVGRASADLGLVITLGCSSSGGHRDCRYRSGQAGRELPRPRR